jgi:serine/threonine-protein kinase
MQDHWETVRALFAQAVDLPAPERGRFLDGVGAHPAVRAEVLALLEAGDLASPRLEPSPGYREALATGPDAGRRIGSYRLERHIGQGGMATVWLAARADALFEKRVAIKLLKRGLDTDALLARFQLERRILAGLEHPHIARLIDAGATEEGLPYLVMEHVEGAPIDAWCDERRASIEDRIRLFAQVCAAVQAAHDRHIVHRDLKPANILVTAAGEPKLLDFGIAKVLAEGGDHAVLTLTGERLLTPRYASPEQVRGEPVSTATDVHALGVVLYELLTGRMPYRCDGSAHDRDLAICESDPRPPSATVTQGVETAALQRGEDGEPGAQALAAQRGLTTTRLRRRLAGDIDTIVLRAMHKDPRRRYACAGHLAADLRAHLEGRPIQARRDTAAYRAAKFAARNRILVGAALTAFAALSIGLLLTLAEYRRAEGLVGELRGQKGIADGVNSFLTEDILLAAHPDEAKDAGVTMREVLDRAAARVGERFAAAPLVEAAVRYTLGEAYFGFGLFAQAEPQFQRAFELRRAHLGEAELPTMLAERDLASTVRFLGRVDEAIALQRPLLERMTRLLGADDGYTMVVASQLAISYGDAQRHDEAEALDRWLLETRVRALGDEHPNTLTTRNNLASKLLQRGKLDEALPLLEQTFAARCRVLGQDHPRTLVTQGNLATLHLRAGRAGEAVRLFESVLAAQQRVIGESHPYLFITTSRLAQACVQAGDPVRAEALHERSLDLALRHQTEHPDHVRTARQGLADLLIGQQRWREAEPHLDALRAGARDEHVLRGLIEVYRHTGRAQQASELETEVASGGR